MVVFRVSSVSRSRNQTRFIESLINSSGAFTCPFGGAADLTGDFQSALENRSLMFQFAGQAHEMNVRGGI